MSSTLKLRNRRPASALTSVAYSPASTAMRFLIRFLLAWPRTTRAVFGIGAVALLFYGASFYTRDWRPVVAQADRPAAAQAVHRLKVEPRPFPSKLAELPNPVEPTTTGALTRMAPAVPAPSAAETVTPRPAPAPLRAQARSPAPRPPKQAKATKRTQVAARSAVQEPTPVAPPPSFLERLFQVRLADRGN
jgi:type IV secretory pathway VirB10-like protein